MSSEDSTASIGIPQIILCAVVLAIVYRYVINSPTTSAMPGSGARNRPGRPISEETIATIQAMFPQASALSIRYDLERNGGNLEATTERILSQGSLPEPPSAYITSSQPSQRTESPTHAQRASQASQRLPAGTTISSSSRSSKTPSDLIARYNLHSRLENFRVGAVSPLDHTVAKKNDKASLFLRGRERRDNMILEARRRMEEKLASL